MRRTLAAIAGLGLAACLAASAAAMPADDLSKAFAGLDAQLPTERAAFAGRRALETAQRDLIDGAILLQADGETQPFAAAYEKAAAEKVQELRAALSDDPAALKQDAAQITSGQFSAKTVRLYVDLSAQRARLIYPTEGGGAGEMIFPISSGNGRIPKGLWTGRGYFDVDRVDGQYRVYKMWHSRSIGNAPMPNSVFFNGGEAAHAAVGSEVAQLGTTPHSHGCVRMPPKMAAVFRSLALQAGPENVGIYVYGEEAGRRAAPLRAPRPVGAPLNILPFSFGR